LYEFKEVTVDKRINNSNHDSPITRMPVIATKEYHKELTYDENLHINAVT
jgi:hypothetical protein